MRILPPALRETVHKLGSGKPYAWLFAIVADEDWDIPPPDPAQGTALFVTSYDQPISYASLLGSPAGSVSYVPFGAKIGTLQADTVGGTPVLQVSVANVFRDVSFRLETGDGFMGRPCRFVAVNVDHLADGPVIEGQGYIRGASANGEVATFGVELYGLASYEVPQAIFIVDRCAWLTQGGYGGEGCGFPLDLVTGAHDPKFKTCPGTLVACKERGDFEVNTLNRPRRHPLRARLFLGLPRLARR